ncbi:MAG: response regulator [Chitinispirillaceae bacterium]|nr:response regulator [Chitinispirillaceae bacterium]
MSLSEKENNRRILVVDDEADVLEFLRMDLEPLGWEVATALSAAEAVRELESRDYFCVLSDIAMPDMDGYEFMSLLQEKKIPSEVLLMTGFGYNPDHTLVKVNKSLRYPCLFKPFDRARVAAAVLQAWRSYNGLSADEYGAKPAPS